MPIYQYHCTSCNTDLEIFARMTDEALTSCPQCQGELRKVFSPVGIVFKGSGFYATDSKKKSSATSLSSTPESKPAPASEQTTATPGADSSSPATTGTHRDSRVTNEVNLGD